MNLGKISETDFKHLKYAVENKVPIEFPYQGKVREACPFLLGKTDKGRYVIHALQTGGESSKGPVKQPEWRFFYLDEFDRGPLDASAHLPWTEPVAKTESTGPYQPPKFITEVIAIHPKQEQ